MSLYLYHIDGAAVATDIKQWASSRDVQNLSNTYSTSDTATIHFTNYKAGGALIDRPFPIVFNGGDTLLYIDYTNSSTYRILGAGLVMTVSGSDLRDNIKGEQVVTISTPNKSLKRIMESVPFNPTDYPTDRSRVLQLGVIANLAGWDWTSGISATPSVTYPVPPVGEALTEYELKSIEDILSDLATDPGRPGDTGYPVPTRHWWIESRLTNTSDPSAGVTWVLRYLGFNDITNAAYELKDRLDVITVPEAGTRLYNTGAKWSENWVNVIRDVYVAGPKTDAVPVAWQNAVNVSRGPGYITKVAGADGTWDAGAVSKRPMKSGDWEAVAQVQEFYLVHHTFQQDDADLIGPANTFNLSDPLHKTQTINYYQDASLNTWGTRSWHAAPKWPVEVAIAVWECHAATCILREHWTTNRQGLGFVFRLTDEDNYWRVENTGGDYALIKRESGGESTVGTLGVTPADNHEIKIFPLGSQIQVYVDNALELQVTGQTFNEHATKHGLYINPEAALTSAQARVYDFQCTTFFSDDAFGIGTETNVTDWVDISYGFVKNNNGTLTLNEGGTPVATDDYSYNDKLRVATMQFFDATTASLQRMVVWEKLPMGESEWERLRTLTTGVVAMSDASPWYVQFAGSDLGATLNNISLRKQYANRFHADPALYGVLADVWPANGMISSDELDTYIKRQTRADAIFRQSALPRVSLSCDLPPRTGAPPFNRGERVLVTNHGAGWLDDGVTDTRQTLYVTGIQRIETGGHLLKPSYRLTLESANFDTDLSGQRHLLKSSVNTKKPDNKGTLTQSADDPDSFYWPDPTGDENFGHAVDVQLSMLGTGQDTEIPMQQVSPDAAGVRIDRGQLVDGVQYTLKYRTRTNSGLTSDWSESNAFTAPPPTPYDRPYSVGEWIGDGSTVIAAGAYDVVDIPESGEIVQWTVKSTDNSDPPIAFPATIEFDVLHASHDDYQANGVSALASIAGTDFPTLSAASSNGSVKLTGWTTAVKAGDVIMFVVKATPTVTAVKITCSLLIRRGVPA